MDAYALEQNDCKREVTELMEAELGLEERFVMWAQALLRRGAAAAVTPPL